MTLINSPFLTVKKGRISWIHTFSAPAPRRAAVVNISLARQHIIHPARPTHTHTREHSVHPQCLDTIPVYGMDGSKRRHKCNRDVDVNRMYLYIYNLLTIGLRILYYMRLMRISVEIQSLLNWRGCDTNCGSHHHRSTTNTTMRNQFYLPNKSINISINMCV